jgi:hypothetical protein
MTAKTYDEIHARAIEIRDRYGADFVYHEVAYTDGCVYFLPIPVHDGEELTDYDLTNLTGEQAEQLELWNSQLELRWACNGPSCLVGMIIEPWLSKENKLWLFEQHNNSSVAQIWDWLVTEEILVNDRRSHAWLSSLQTSQDASVPWGMAIENADMDVENLLLDV